MPTLLLKIAGNRSFNRTLFPPRLYIYDDLLKYKKRNFIMSKEITFSYSQISMIDINKGIFFFAELELATTGKDNYKIRWVPKGKAEMAKKIIDQKIYHAHARHRPGETPDNQELHNYEKSLARLKELRNKDAISQRDFNRMKKDLLKKIK